ncbi:MAG: Glycosyl transferase CpsE [uncultured bacterium]|nr:MAG: Glycosyl transferase CpsE [uncultured bacterium]
MGTSKVSAVKGKSEELNYLLHLIASSNKAIKDDTGLMKAYPFWIARNYNLSSRRPFQWAAKRAIDFIGSTLGVILISPILALIALAIKLDSKGPILFKQERIGLYGKKFYMYKFRSMRQGAEEEFEQIRTLNETNDVMFKMVDDPRITKIGKILRKYSLDELPQLLNVIRGEMSLVGPRPPLEREIEKYDKWHYLKFATMPGLTGLWQVSGRAGILDFNDVIKFDYRYVNNWNLKLDFYLLLKTIPVVLLAKGAA